jgi:phosphoglycolate phosphatase
VLIVFDLDGTLIDSREDLAAAANATLVAFGHAPLPVDAVARMVGEGARVLVDRLFAARDAPLRSRALEAFLRLYADRLVVHTHVYPGVPETIAELARRATLGVLTNKPRLHSDRLLQHFGLAPYMFRVIGGDAPLPLKPDPAGLAALMREAGVAPAGTLLVGDSWVDHETAVRAGVRICLARYGFGFEQIPRDRLHGDEIVIDTPRDLLRYVPEGDP